MDAEQPLTKKERREKRRLERSEMEQSDKNKKTYHRVVSRAAIVLVIIVVIYGIFVLRSNNQAQNPGQSVSIQGRQHIAAGAEHPQYNSNPPTSGWHYDQPTPWGIYQNELIDENVIHSLEHGGMWISYQPDIDEETKTALENIGKRFSGSVVVSPRSANDSPIAVASWGRLMKLDAFDENLIIEFVTQNKNKSPEPLAR